MFLDLFQQPRDLLDPVADRRAVLRGLFPLRLFRLAIQRTPRDGGDLIQIAFERCFPWLPLPLLRFEKQLRLGENPLTRLLGSGVAPRTVEHCGAARGPVALREDHRHPLAMFHAASRHRSQIPHGDLRGDAAFAHLLLHRFRQGVHQRQAARDPGRAAVETPRQFFDCVAVLLFHLG